MWNVNFPWEILVLTFLNWYVIISSMSKFGCLVSRSMLNCVNALDQRLPASERAALMVAEEKPLPDSCKHPSYWTGQGSCPRLTARCGEATATQITSLSQKQTFWHEWKFLKLKIESCCFSLLRWDFFTHCLLTLRAPSASQVAMWPRNANTKSAKNAPLMSLLLPELLKVVQSSRTCLRDDVARWRIPSPRDVQSRHCTGHTHFILILRAGTPTRTHSHHSVPWSSVKTLHFLRTPMIR